MMGMDEACESLKVADVFTGERRPEHFRLTDSTPISQEFNDGVFYDGLMPFHMICHVVNSHDALVERLATLERLVDGYKERHRHSTDYQMAREFATACLKRCIVIDTETTGIDKNSEIIEVGIIDHTGKVLFDSLIKPVHPIPAEVTAINGITNEMVANAPTWDQVYSEIKQIVEENLLVAFNAEFDLRMIEQTCSLYGLPLMMSAIYKLTERNILHHCCAMKMYAQYYGEWKVEEQTYRRQSLTRALEQQGITVDAPAHRAVGDTLRTLALLQSMAA